MKKIGKSVLSRVKTIKTSKLTTTQEKDKVAEKINALLWHTIPQYKGEGSAFGPNAIEVDFTKTRRDVIDKRIQILTKNLGYNKPVKRTKFETTFEGVVPDILALTLRHKNLPTVNLIVDKKRFGVKKPKLPCISPYKRHKWRFKRIGNKDYYVCTRKGCKAKVLTSEAYD